MPKRTPKSKPPAPAADWRADAEARGAAAFEEAVNQQPEPEPIPPRRKRKEEITMKKPQRKQTATTPAAAPEPAPDWVTETHPEHDYALILFESGDSSVEYIDVTRCEYIGLKHHLARMRGIIVPADPDDDLIRQSELLLLAKMRIQFDAKVIAIRRRMREGAVVEPGAICATSDSEKCHTIEWYEEPYVSFYAAGLTVDWRDRENALCQ